MSNVPTQGANTPTLRAIRDAAKRAVDRCDTEGVDPSSNPWQMFADELDRTIRAASEPEEV